MTSEELSLALLKVSQDQTEAIKAGFRELTILSAEKNALLAKQNSTLADGIDNLCAVLAEAFEVELEEGEGDEDAETTDDDAS